MKFVFGGADVTSARKMLLEAGVERVAFSYLSLSRRHRTTKNLSDLVPDNIELHIYPGSTRNVSESEAFDLNESYQAFVSLNADRLSSWTEYDSQVMGSEWIIDQRRFWADLPQEKFRPVLHHVSDMPALASLFNDICLPGQMIDTDPTLMGRSAVVRNREGTRFHGLGTAKPDSIRWLDTAMTLAWTSPMRHSHLLIFDKGRWHRYGSVTEEAISAHRNLLVSLGILDEIDSPVVRAKLAIWSLLRLEEHINRGVTDRIQGDDSRREASAMSGNNELADNYGESSGADFADNASHTSDNSAPVVRKPPEPRDPDDQYFLPVFAVSSKTILDEEDGRQVIREVPVVQSNPASLRSCDSCFVSDRCPAMKPGSDCAFLMPVEVKTKEQLLSMLNAVIEMQGMRVAFSRFSEELNGGYMDPAVGIEIDRLFRIVKQSKEIQENRETFRMTVERKSSGGVLSAIFGEKAALRPEDNLPFDGRIIEQAIEPGDN